MCECAKNGKRMMCESRYYFPVFIFYSLLIIKLSIRVKIFMGSISNNGPSTILILLGGQVSTSVVVLRFVLN